MKFTKEELEQHREWLKSNIEPLQSKLNQVEAELKKLNEPKFDFQKLMPVGSVWLGKLKVLSHNDQSGVVFLRTDNTKAAVAIYYAHQIVKAAIHYVKEDGEGWHELNDAVLASEYHGVLLNLE